MDRYTRMEQALAILQDENALAQTNRYYSGWMNVHEVAHMMRCSYPVASAALKALLSDQLIERKWTHAHRSYWESYYRIAQ